MPTLRDLDQVIETPGPDNDLVDLTKLQNPLTKIAIGPVHRHGKKRQGAFPESVDSLDGSLKQLAFFRAYSPELTGWFDDFGHSGIVDANGGIGRDRRRPSTPSRSAPTACPDLLGGVQTPQAQIAGMSTGNLERCPGSNERPAPDGTNPFTETARSTATPTRSRRGTDDAAHPPDRSSPGRRRGSRARRRRPASDSHTYFIEFDNAFGLVNGSEVKVAGVAQGTIERALHQLRQARRRQGDALRPAQRARQGHDLLLGAAVADRRVLHRLHARRAPPLTEQTGSDETRTENPDIPVAADPADRPERPRAERAADALPGSPDAILINEFGTALAGNAENLNAAIRRGAPALTAARKVT